MTNSSEQNQRRYER